MTLADIKKYMSSDAVLPAVKQWSWNGAPMTAITDALKMVNPALSTAVKAASDPVAAQKSATSVAEVLSDPLGYLKNRALDVVFVVGAGVVLFIYIKNQVSK